jgi:D-threo-aldose 1-dehydrogenase
MTTTYNLLDHGPALSELLPFCQEQGFSYWAAGPFVSRVLAKDPRTAKSLGFGDGKARFCFNGDPTQVITFNYHDITAGELERACLVWNIAQEYGEESPRAMALQFCLANEQVSEVVIGAGSAERFDELLRDIEHEINPGVWGALRAQGIIDPRAPTPE